MDYRKEHDEILRYIEDALTWCNDAETALSIFIDRANPQTGEAEGELWDVEIAHKTLKAWLKDHENTLYQMIQDLPERDWPDVTEDDCDQAFEVWE